MKEAMRHGVVSLLTALGLALALLGCMDMLAHGWMAAAVIAALTLVLTLAWVKKLTRFIALGALLAGGVLWLLAGGVEQIAEILRAVTLHFTGLNGVLPMVAQPAALILSAVLAVAAFVLTGPGGRIPNF